MTKRTIKLKDYLHVMEEYAAVAAITPGMLIELTSTGEVQVHGAAAGVGEKMFADEDQFQGKTIADAYAVGDKVSCWLPQRGDVVYAFLADGENVAVGAKLVSDGAGALQEVSSSEENVIAVALETVDLSAAGAIGRIIARIV